MVGEKVTLNELIQVANKKVATGKEALAQLAAKENFQGTPEEIMSYVEENDKVFADPNLDDIKTALSNFLSKMDKEKMKITLASMKRELEEFKAQTPPSEDDGNGLLTQSDLDALLAQAATQNQGRQPRIVAPVAEEPQDDKDGDAGSTQDTFDQAEIDALLNSRTSGKDAPEETKEPEAEDGVVMDQDTIDALLAQGAEQPELPADAMNPEGDEPQGGDANPLDAGEPEGHVESASEANDMGAQEDIDDDLDQAGIDALLQAQKVNQTADVKQQTDDAESAAAIETPDHMPDEAPEETETLESADQSAPHAEEVRSPLFDISDEEPPLTEEPIQDFASQSVLEEKGAATILREYYRIYVRNNGTFHSLFETEDKEIAKQNLQTAMKDYPAKNVVLGKITQKEVLVVKEDVKEIPVAVQVDFGD